MDLDSTECLSSLLRHLSCCAMQLHVAQMTLQEITEQCKAKCDKYDMACPKQYLLLVDQLSFKS